MNDLFTQRWRARRDSYRPAGEVIDTRHYEVAAIDHDAEAKSFVCAHHYSASYPAARFRFGLYRAGQLQGVAIFSVPCRDEVLTNVFPVDPMEATDLGRFVLLDEVPGNGETWFLARCFEQLRRQGIVGVTSASDPESRDTAAGVIVFGGHVGTIYQSHNGRYLGRATPRTLKLLPDGSLLSDRAISKVRAKLAGKSAKQCRGWEYACRLLESQGADPCVRDLRQWWRHWLPHLTRSRRHQGNHKYAWGLTRTMRRLMPEGSEYPKLWSVK
jgi:hypothetical protein